MASENTFALFVSFPLDTIFNRGIGGMSRMHVPCMATLATSGKISDCGYPIQPAHRAIIFCAFVFFPFDMIFWLR